MDRVGKKFQCGGMTISFASRLRTTRSLKGLTQQDLADRLGVSRTAVGQWEVGRSRPSVRNLKKLGDILSTTFHDEDAADASVALEVFADTRVTAALPEDPDNDCLIPLSYVAAGPRAELFRNSLENPVRPRDWVQWPFNLRDEASVYAILIATDCFSPLYKADDIAYAAPAQAVLDGDMVLIATRIDDSKANGYLRKALVITEQEIICEGIHGQPRQIVPRDTIEFLHRLVPWRELVTYRRSKALGDVDRSAPLRNVS